MKPLNKEQLETLISKVSQNKGLVRGIIRAHTEAGGSVFDCPRSHLDPATQKLWDTVKGHV